MQLTPIINNLAHSEKLPEETIRKCLDLGDDIVPAFLSILIRFTENTPLSDAEEQAIFLIVHLLGEIGDKRAFPVLLDFLQADQDRINDVLSDALTETVPSIVISTFDGDVDRLVGLINNPNVVDVMRAGAMEVWAYFVARGDIPRDVAHQQLSNWFSGLQPQGEDYIWVPLVKCVAMLNVRDLANHVYRLFDLGWVPYAALRREDFDRRLDQVHSTSNPMEVMERYRIGPFTDTIGTLSSWHGYSDEYIARKRMHEQGDQGGIADTYVNRFKSIGRNDPCPCGSGKKFKKCCLH